MKTNPEKNLEPEQPVNSFKRVDPYKRIARIYDRLFEPFNSGLRAIGKKMYSPYEGMAVLDVGCGTGVHLELYQKAGCVVFGIDLSQSMLHVARRRLGEGAHLHLGDASKMPYMDMTFDLIIMSTILHEMPGEVRSVVLDESSRILKENGRILLIDYHPGPVRSIKGWFYKSVITLAEIIAGREHYKNYRNFLENKGLPGLVASHELSIEKEKIISSGTMTLMLLRAE